MTQEDKALAYRNPQGDGGLSAQEAAQANPGGINSEALRDVDPSGEADCLSPNCQEKPLARVLVSVP